MEWQGRRILEHDYFAKKLRMVKFFLLKSNLSTRSNKNIIKAGVITESVPTAEFDAYQKATGEKTRARTIVFTLLLSQKF